MSKWPGRFEWRVTGGDWGAAVHGKFSLGSTTAAWRTQCVTAHLTHSTTKKTLFWVHTSVGV